MRAYVQKKDGDEAALLAVDHQLTRIPALGYLVIQVFKKLFGRSIWTRDIRRVL